MSLNQENRRKTFEFPDDVLDELFSHLVDLPPMMDHGERPEHFPLTISKCRRSDAPTALALCKTNKQFFGVVTRRLYKCVVLTKPSHLLNLGKTEGERAIEGEDNVRWCRQLCITFRTNGLEVEIHRLLDRMPRVRWLLVWLPSRGLFCTPAARVRRNIRVLQIGSLPMNFNAVALQSMARGFPALRTLQVYDCPAVGVGGEQQGRNFAGKFWKQLEVLQIGFPGQFVPEAEHARNMFLAWIAGCAAQEGMLESLSSLTIFGNVGGLHPFLARFGHQLRTFGCAGSDAVLGWDGGCRQWLGNVRIIELHVDEYWAAALGAAGMGTVHDIVLINPVLAQRSPSVHKMVVETIDILRQTWSAAPGTIRLEVDREWGRAARAQVQGAFERAIERGFTVLPFLFRMFRFCSSARRTNTENATFSS